MVRIKDPWEREDCMTGAKQLSQKAIDSRQKKKIAQNKENEAMAKDIAGYMVSQAKERLITH